MADVERPNSPFYGRMLKTDTLKKHKEWESKINALLADLQNTVSPDTSLIGGNSVSTPGYGSLNGTRTHGTSGSYKTYENRSTPPVQSQSPTYQNREAIEEAQARSGIISSGNQYNQSASGAKMPSLNNNLSELDTLLQDLSNARYNSNTQDRDIRPTNGGATSPMMRSTSSLSATRPTVDSLLEELSTGLPNGDYPGEQRVKVTIEERSTEVQPGEIYYPPSQHGSLNRRDIEHSYTVSNGHTASNATKELDDLMASLSEFKRAAPVDDVKVPRMNLTNVETSSTWKPNERITKTFRIIERSTTTKRTHY